MSVNNPNQVHQTWLQIAEKVKDRVIAPTLYRALELGVGLAIEDDHFILGFSSADLPMAGHLRSSQHLSVIEKCIAEVTKQKLRLRIIEGTTLQDYANYKKLRSAAENVRTSISDQRERDRKIEQAWEEVSEKITRGFAKYPLRQLSTTRGIFIREAFKFLNQAVDQIGFSEQSEEIHKRAFSRVMEKFSSVVEVPSAMLAYEFFKLRDEGKLK